MEEEEEIGYSLNKKKSKFSNNSLVCVCVCAIYLIKDFHNNNPSLQQRLFYQFQIIISTQNVTLFLVVIP